MYSTLISTIIKNVILWLLKPWKVITALANGDTQAALSKADQSSLIGSIRRYFKLGPCAGTL